MDNPVVRHYHFLIWLDQRVLGTCVTLLLASVAAWGIARYRRREKLATAFDAFGQLVGVAGVLYLVWRVFFAWKGYYP
jgi:hypothetical protein